MHEVLFFLRRQFGFENEIEEFDRILQGQEPPVVQVWRRVLYAAQGKRLDWPIGAGQHAIDHLRLVKALPQRIAPLCSSASLLLRRLCCPGFYVRGGVADEES